MNYLVLINGCGGAGKDTSGRLVLRYLGKGALIDIKALTRVEPWEFGGEVAQLGLRNAAALANNFLAAGFSPVLFTGGVNRQEYLNTFCSLVINLCIVDYFWIDVPKSIRDERRIARARDEADKREHLDKVDSVFTDPGVLSIPSGRYHRISYSSQPASEIAKYIVEQIACR